MVLILLLLFLSVSDLGCFGKLFSETGSWPFIREVCWTRFGLFFLGECVWGCWFRFVVGRIGFGYVSGFEISALLRRTI